MKKTILLVVIALLAVIMQKPTELIALDTYTVEQGKVQVVRVVPVQNGGEAHVKELVEIYSKKYNVSKFEMMRTLRNENDTFQCERQSGLKYKAGNRWGFPAGTIEKSYGVAQIHLPDHPTVTIAQAKSCEFSVEFMAKEFSKGRAWQWMGYLKK